jgi:hypothetical protein
MSLLGTIIILWDIFSQTNYIPKKGKFATFAWDGRFRRHCAKLSAFGHAMFSGKHLTIL